MYADLIREILIIRAHNKNHSRGIKPCSSCRSSRYGIKSLRRHGIFYSSYQRTYEPRKIREAYLAFTQGLVYTIKYIYKAAPQPLDLSCFIVLILPDKLTHEPTCVLFSLTVYKMIVKQPAYSRSCIFAFQLLFQLNDRRYYSVSHTLNKFEPIIVSSKFIFPCFAFDIPFIAVVLEKSSFS